MNSKQPKISLAIFASGKGSNAEKIIGYFRHHPTIQVALIVSSRADAGVVQVAQTEKIPHIVIHAPEFRTNGAVTAMEQYKIDWIILAGFLWKVPATLLNAYPSKIINLHPSLLPAYGGKGMYGMAVHHSVLAAGEKESGITIHYIDEEYDRGSIILQEKLSISENETPESLAQRIHALEHLHFAPAIEKVVLADKHLPIG